MFANPYDDFTDITNEIDSKIVELLNLKQEIEHTIYLLKAINAIPISKTAYRLLLTKIGNTISEFAPSSQAICPGNLWTSFTRTTSCLVAHAPQTPFENGI